jgi:hypothetical protein
MTSPRPSRRSSPRSSQAAEVLEERVLPAISPLGPQDLTGFENGRWVVSLGTTDRSGGVTSQWDQWSNVAWTFVGEGDFNADGLNDVIGLYQGSWYVGLSTGASYNRFLGGRASRWAQWSSTAAWRDIRIADLNGDGKSDILARAGNVFYAAVTNAATTAFVFTTASGAWATTGGLAFQSLFLADVGNPNGTAAADGRADLVALTTDGSWVASLSTGASFVNLNIPNQPFWTIGTAWSSASSWQGLTVADMNGDGLGDVVGFRNGQWQAGLSTGTAFNTVQLAQWAAVSQWRDARIGNFDNAGNLDIAARYNGQWWVQLAGTNKASLWGTWSNTVTWLDVRVGDFDNDGFDDIAGRYGSQWYVGFTTTDANATFGLSFRDLRAWANWSAFGTANGWLAVATVQAGSGQVVVASIAASEQAAATAPPTSALKKDPLLLWARIWDDELERGLYGAGV